MTFSSSTPLLHVIALIYAVVQYWFDKIMLLRFYRKQNSFSFKIVQDLVAWMPLASVLHMLFGFMMFSYPELLRSPVVDGYFGNQSQYFKPERIGQNHMILYTAGCIITFIVILNNVLFSKCACCGKNKAPQPEKLEGKEEEVEIVTPAEEQIDLFEHLDFIHLHSQYDHYK